MKYLMVKTQTGNTIATDIQSIFSTFHFQIYLLWSFTTKLLILQIQCLFRVGSSILAGVFLTSFVLCLNLHIPQMQQVAAYWQLGTQTALVQLVGTSQQWLQKLGVVQLHRSLRCGVKLIQITATHHQTVAVMVTCDLILCDLCGDSLWRVFWGT